MLLLVGGAVLLAWPQGIFYLLTKLMIALSCQSPCDTIMNNHMCAVLLSETNTMHISQSKQ